jgi:hypothetical protein
MRIYSISTIILLFSFFLPILALSQSQDSSKLSGLEGGFITGINFSYLDRFGPYQTWAESAGSEPSGLWGMAGGAYFQYALFSFLQLRAEFQPSNYGGCFYNSNSYEQAAPQFTGKSESITVNEFRRHIYQMNYLEFPLLLRGSLSPSKGFHLFVEAGVSYRRLLSSYYTSDNQRPSSPTFVRFMDKVDISDFVALNGWNYQLGTGLRVNVKTRVVLEAGFRYTNSISRVFADDIIEVYEDKVLVAVYDMVTHLHSFQLRLGMGYRF